MSEEMRKGLSYAGGIISAVLIGTLTLCLLFGGCAGSYWVYQRVKIAAAKEEAEILATKEREKTEQQFKELQERIKADLERAQMSADEKKWQEENETRRAKLKAETEEDKRSHAAKMAALEAEKLRLALEEKMRLDALAAKKEHEARVKAEMERNAAVERVKEEAIAKRKAEREAERSRVRTIAEAYSADRESVITVQGEARCKVFKGGTGRFLFRDDKGRDRLSAAVTTIDKEHLKVIPEGEEITALVKIRGRMGGYMKDVRILSDCTVLEAK